MQQHYSYQGCFAQKGPLKNLRGRDKKRAVRGREGAVKEPQNLKRGRKRFLNTASHQSPPLEPGSIVLSLTYGDCESPSVCHFSGR